MHIQKAKDGTYLGTVAETVERPDYKPAEFCRDCPAPFTNRRIIDMPLVWNVRPDPRKEFHYVDGYAIDPLSGKIYAGDFRLSTDGRRLSMRGKVIGAGFLNRTQTWLREANYTPKSHIVLQYQARCRLCFSSGCWRNLNRLYNSLYKKVSRTSAVKKPESVSDVNTSDVDTSHDTKMRWIEIYTLKKLD